MFFRLLVAWWFLIEFGEKGGPNSTNYAILAPARYCNPCNPFVHIGGYTLSVDFLLRHALYSSSCAIGLKGM